MRVMRKKDVKLREIKKVKTMKTAKSSSKKQKGKRDLTNRVKSIGKGLKGAKSVRTDAAEMISKALNDFCERLVLRSADAMTLGKKRTLRSKEVMCAFKSLADEDYNDQVFREMALAIGAAASRE
eukprot:TRINITY_DN8777_c2_g2_i1.p1 TRINITY_DN8777_c2_g2~~TRINITY_DN8777_c2_g2_i1.p1  ORF type:complete len:139 (+),score=19.47 TRINITY_DN8777_c2_g2_i1:43-417(+)